MKASSGFRNTYLQEAADQLEILETGFLALEQDPRNADVLDSVFRAAHCIKGSSGTFGFSGIASFTHNCEEALERVRSGRLVLNPAMARLFLQFCDCLRLLLDAATRGVACDMTRIRSVSQQFQEILDASEESAPEASTGADWRIEWTPPRESFRRRVDVLRLLHELLEQGRTDVKLETDDIPSLPDLDPQDCHLAWSLQLSDAPPLSDLEDIVDFARGGFIVESLNASDSQPITPVEPSASLAPDIAARLLVDTASIRVDVGKIDHLINLVGELVTTQSMISDLGRSFDPERFTMFQERVDQLERNTRDIHERVMSIRMLPIGGVFNRFRRVVRDITLSSGKDVRLDFHGADTEIDKNVIESITDPLTHLVRNAIDHGIESAEERLKFGKPEVGTIRLEASQEGGSIVLSVADDGQGLDTKKILAKAVKHGLVDPQAELTDEQIQELIFQPGFSTAGEVTGMSGRGVGMDVVQQNVVQLGGSIEISSTPGKGSRVTLRLPTTLAILEGLMVRVGDDVFIPPLTSIVEFFRPSPEEVRSLLGQGETICYRGACLPVLRLQEIFGCESKAADSSAGLLAVVEVGDVRACLLVDELLGQQQVVLKSLETHYRRVPGISGASVLGDGRVALILDMPGVFRLAKRKKLLAAHGVRQKAETRG